MQSSARLFNCARCQSQVVICSQCDRGNRYCGRACARVARRQSMRAVRIPPNVTGHSGDRDRCVERSGAGVAYSDRSVTISQLRGGFSHGFSVEREAMRVVQ